MLDGGVGGMCEGGLKGKVTGEFEGGEPLDNKREK